MLATFEDFQKLDIRIGTIKEAKPFPGARKPAYMLQIDFGELGEKKTSAQITDLYDVKDLLGKRVVAVVNFPDKQIATFMSEVLVLGVPDEHGHVVLLEPERSVSPGVRVY